jgi:RNAse (barnase) inhibitor barstar
MIDNIFFYIVRSLHPLEHHKALSPKIVTVNGMQTTTLLDFYKIVGTALSFGPSFGNNLDALFDTMTDLSWINEHAIEFHFSHSKDLLSNESVSVKNNFVNTLNDIAYENDLAPELDAKKPKQIRYLFEESTEIEDLLEENFIIWEKID